MLRHNAEQCPDSLFYFLKTSTSFIISFFFYSFFINIYICYCYYYPFSLLCGRMLKFRERLSKNCLPAFNLELVYQCAERALEEELNETCSAAKCVPMSGISERIFVGTWRDAADEKLLRQMCITHTLNVARELVDTEEMHRVESVPFVTSKSIPLSDSLDEDIVHHFEDAFEFIRGATRNGRILVYCRRGMSRSAAIVVAYLMESEGMSFCDAHNDVKDKRPCISLNLAFLQRLQEYEEHLEKVRAAARTN